MFEPRIFRLLFSPEDKGGTGGGNSKGGKKEGAGDPANEKDKSKGKEADDDEEEEEEESDDGEKGKVDELPPWAQKLVKGLRKENADHRTKNKGLDDRLTKFETGMKNLFGGDGQKMSPEEQVEQLTTNAQQAEMRNAVLTLALENGISADKIDYLAYKIQSAVNGLADDQELPDEELEKIVSEVKGLSGSKSDTKNADSSVEGDDDPEKKPGKTGSMTLEEFVKLGIMGKSELYRKDAATYNKLMGEARSKGLIK